MFMHTLDISQVHEGYATWCEINVFNVAGQVPEDMFFYSLSHAVQVV